MKNLVLIAALVLASTSVHASTYRSGKSTVVVPHGCHSWSCISVSVAGYYSHNVHRAPQAHRRDSNTAVSTTATPATAAAPATVAPATPAAPTAAPATRNSGSSVMVLPAPAAPAQQ